MGAAASSNVAAPASSSHVAAPASSSSHVAARRLRLVPVVAPRPIAPLARSVNAGIAPTALTLGLPVAKYAAFAAQGYSNTWLNDLHLSDECLEPFVSKHKLDLLVQEGALKIGDELYMEVDVSVEEGEMQVVEKVAKVRGLASFLPLPSQDMLSFGFRFESCVLGGAGMVLIWALSTDHQRQRPLPSRC